MRRTGCPDRCDTAAPDAASLQTNLLLLAAAAAGAILGILLLNRIPQKLFNTAAVKLILE